MYIYINNNDLHCLMNTLDANTNLVALISLVEFEPHPKHFDQLENTKYFIRG